jgi:hypothetical protein
MYSQTRSAPRIDKLSFISFVEKENGEQRSPVSMGRTINISATGLGIESFQEIPEGAAMEMDISLGDEIIHARGKVVRSTKLANGAFFLGINFDDFQERLETVVLEKI